MTAIELSPATLATYAVAFLFPFTIAFALARRGQVKTAWWLPGGMFAMTVVFVWLAMQLDDEMQTGIGAAWTLGAIAVPAILGGVVGILLGRKRS